MKTALIGATVFDGTRVIGENQTILIDGTTIQAIGEGLAVEAGIQSLDVTGKTVIPGIIDCHVHFASWAQWLVSLPQHRLMWLAARTAYAFQKTLESGVTAARDLGGLDSGFVQAVDDGLLVGPRLQTCVTLIHPVNGAVDNIPGMGGHTSQMGTTLVIPGMPSPYCSGPWEVRAKVREVLRAGAQVIKIASSTQSIGGKVHWDMPAFTYEELAAAAEEAHAVGLKITTHTMGAEQTIMTALRAGVDGIEHGWGLSDRVLEEMASRKVWLIPTIWIADFHQRHDPDPDNRAHATQLFEATLDTVRRAAKAGVPIAMGSDAGEHGIGGSMEEIEWMVYAGMSTVDALAAATSKAAEWLGMADTVGTLRPGQQADLLVIDGDPLTSISTLRTGVDLVLKAGEPVGGRLARRLTADEKPLVFRLPPLPTSPLLDQERIPV